MDTVQVRFRKKYHQYLMHAFVVALVVHFLVFYLVPPFEFTPYRPVIGFEPIPVPDPAPVPIIQEPKDVPQPKIKHVPIVSAEPGDQDADLPITSPYGIHKLAFAPMPAQETQEFVTWDRMPVLLEAFTPAYPELAREGGIEGKVLLRVTIAANGLVEAVSVIRSDLPPSMEKAAIAAVMKFKFAPAMQGNIAVRSLMAVPVMFRLH